MYNIVAYTFVWCSFLSLSVWWIFQEVGLCWCFFVLAKMEQDMRGFLLKGEFCVVERDLLGPRWKHTEKGLCRKLSQHLWALTDLRRNRLCMSRTEDRERGQVLPAPAARIPQRVRPRPSQMGHFRAQEGWHGCASGCLSQSNNVDGYSAYFSLTVTAQAKSSLWPREASLRSLGKDLRAVHRLSFFHPRDRLSS